MPEVTMKNGTKVNFGERSKVVKQSRIDEVDQCIVISFAYRDGEVTEWRMPFDHKMILRAAMHGMDQKIGDGNATLDDVEDMRASFAEITKQIDEGEWNEKRGGDGLAGTSVLLQALMEVLGVDKDGAKAMLADCSAAEKAALRKTPPIDGVVARIEAEKASKKQKKPNEVGQSVLARLQAAAA